MRAVRDDDVAARVALPMYPRASLPKWSPAALKLVCWRSPAPGELVSGDGDETPLRAFFFFPPPQRTHSCVLAFAVVVCPTSFLRRSLHGQAGVQTTRPCLFCFLCLSRKISLFRLIFSFTRKKAKPAAVARLRWVHVRRLSVCLSVRACVCVDAVRSRCETEEVRVVRAKSARSVRLGRGEAQQRQPRGKRGKKKNKHLFFLTPLQKFFLTHETTVYFFEFCDV